MGIEPMTYGLRNRCSTPELHWRMRGGAWGTIEGSLCWWRSLISRQYAGGDYSVRVMRAQSSGRPWTPLFGEMASLDLLIFSPGAASGLSPS